MGRFRTCSCLERSAVHESWHSGEHKVQLFEDVVEDSCRRKCVELSESTRTLVWVAGGNYQRSLPHIFLSVPQGVVPLICMGQEL